MLRRAAEVDGIISKNVASQMLRCCSSGGTTCVIDLSEVIIIFSFPQLSICSLAEVAAVLTAANTWKCDMTYTLDKLMSEPIQNSVVVAWTGQRGRR